MVVDGRVLVSDGAVAGPPRSALATHLFAGLGSVTYGRAPALEEAPLKTRITEMLGIEIPIVQAPMGWIARSPLAGCLQCRWARNHRDLLG